MNQTHQALSNIWNRFQASLFPWLQEELGELTAKQQPLVGAGIAQIETHLPYVGQVFGLYLPSGTPGTSAPRGSSPSPGSSTQRRGAVGGCREFADVDVCEDVRIEFGQALV